MPVDKEKFCQLTGELCDMINRFEQGEHEIKIGDQSITVDDMKLLINDLRDRLSREVRQIMWRKKIGKRFRVKKLMQDLESKN